MGNPFEAISPTPETEPGVCVVCKAIHEVPRGVVSTCTAHDPPGQVVTIPVLFRALGPVAKDLDKGTPNDQVRVCLQLLQILQNAVLAEQEVPAPPTQ